MSSNAEKIRGAIEVLEEELRDQQAAVNTSKQVINALCIKAGLDAMYIVEDSDSSSSLAEIKGDTFYGRPLATVVKEYLTMRRMAGSGPATIPEIHENLFKGGYVFTAVSDKSARDGLRISLGKNQLFHKLPNGSYGLSEWYPNAKKNDDRSVTPRRRRSPLPPPVEEEREDVEENEE